MVANRRRKGLHEYFVKQKGPWPHPCYFCGEEVDGHTVPFNGAASIVHHIDGNHWNNAPENLASAHQRCHACYHASNQSDYHKAQISASQKALWADPAHRAKMVPKMGKWQRSAEAREKASATNTKLWAPDSELRQRVSEKMKARWQDPAYRAKQAAAGVIVSCPECDYICKGKASLIAHRLLAHPS